MKVDKKTTGIVQSTLDGVLEKAPYLKSYTREGALHAVAQFVACDNQVREMLMLLAEIDILRPGPCCYREAYIQKLPCCNEAKDDVERLTQ
jgi:hypothetical protein